MRRKQLLLKAGAYIGTIVIVNAACLLLAHLGWMHSNYYGLIILPAIAVFLFYYWLETLAHKRLHLKRAPFAIVVLLSQFLLSVYSSILYCIVFGLTYQRFGDLKINDAEWMILDIYCTILHVVILRIAIGVLRYIIHVMKSKNFF